MASSGRKSNEILLEQLKNGTARFEISTSFVPPIQQPRFRSYSSHVIKENGPRFFARIGPSLGELSPVTKKVEHYTIQKVTGDGRCMFRALVKGMASNRGSSLLPRQERDDADELRMAVKEILCGNLDERNQYQEALVAITVEESLKRYCQRIERSDFWGGESELLVLSKLCQQPIVVYIPENEHAMGWRGNGFIPIAEYGSEYKRASDNKKLKKPVRLLYSGGNHYDLLI